MATQKGRYRVKNLEKYAGDPTNVWYRSSWERKFMTRMDNDPNVVSWNSEEIVIPYRSKHDGRIHRYYPDFSFKRKDGKKFLVEIKPRKETIPPVKEGKSQKRFISECVTYARNVSKWEAAERWCESRGYTFLILTENELGVSPRLPRLPRAR